jgi:uncharacterized membrane protein YdbT with pleckstrin-like domain
MEFNLDEYFCPVPGSPEEKNIILFTRRHWASFLGQIILSVFLFIFPILIWIVATSFNRDVFSGVIVNFIIVALGIYYLVAITFSFTAWITYYYDIFIVTKDTVVDIKQEGFFGRKIAQLSLLRIQDVSSDIKGFLPTIFAYGDVLVETAGEKSETFLFQGVPNPQAFSAKILELHNKLIEEEGRRMNMTKAEGVMDKQDFSSEQKEEKQPSYQEMIQKEIKKSQPWEFHPKEEFPKREEGEINKDDLNKGGEVKF